MSDKLKRLQELSPEKRALLEKMLKDKSAVSIKQTISAKNVKEHIPLSFAEQRLWFIEQLESGSATYNTSSVLKLRGSLNVSALTYSLEKIVSRHNILRSAYKLVEGKPFRFVNESSGLNFSFTDFSDMQEDDKLLKVKSVIRDETTKIFDLKKGDVLRVKLIKLDDGEHVLILTVHHIVSDGWSLGIIVNEFVHFYDEFVNQKKSSLEDLPIQYGDYAFWQMEELDKDKITQQQAYWGKALDGLPPLIDFPTDRPRPSVLSSNGAEVGFSVSTEISQELKKLCRAESCTLFVMLLTAFKLFVFRYAGVNDVAIGTTIANRPFKELESLIGLFVNSLALRSKITASMSFRELLSSVKATTLDAYKNQDIPFEQVVEYLKVERTLGYAPITQLRFVLNNIPSTELNLPKVQVEPMRLDFVPAKMDLLLSMSEYNQELHGSLQYSTDLFNRDTMENVVHYFNNILGQIVDNPEKKISSFQLSGEMEYSKIVHDWNKTEVSYPDSICVNELFERVAANAPGKVAVIESNEEYSYAEINSRANQIANLLIDRGVAYETRIGILLPYSSHTITSMLGVMKSGAAYVPIDIKFPASRIKSICDDADIKFVISSQECIESTDVTDIEFLNLDVLNLSGYSMENPALDSFPHRMAYMVYTSGSTGTPKGVCVEHHSIINYIHAVHNRLSLSANAEMASMSSIAADLGYTAIFGSLCTGRALRIIPETSHLNAQELKAILLDRSIDALKIVPSHLSALLSVDNEIRLPNECLIFGGEILRSEVINQVRAINPNIRIINHYGPTETTVGVITYEVPFSSEVHSLLLRGSLPIGRPIGNTRIYILDEELNPVAVGVAGDLYIAGDNLSRGYWMRPGMTAEKFIPDHFSSSKGARLYKTGDRARYSNEGNIYFLGRADNQAKVNGYRIELGEIECAFKKINLVKDAAVIVDKKNGGTGALIAFIVAAEENEILIRNLLSDQLPAYMIPAVINFIEEVPRMVNGKINLAALIKIENKPQKLFEAPVTPTEIIIAKIWEEELSVNNVARTDDFFKLGGHSLLAVLVVFRISETFKIEFPVSNLISNPTLQQLAEFLDSRIDKQDSLKLTAQDRSNGIPISLAQERLWFLYQRDKESTAYYMPSALEIRGTLNVEVFEQSFHEVIQRHEVLRTTFMQVDNNIRQIIHADKVISRLEILDLRSMASIEKEAIVKNYLQKGIFENLNLEVGPLFRVVLLQMEEQRSALISCIHHIISDGWSQRVLFNDFFKFYDAKLSGKKPSIPDLTVQYADYAIWERARFDNEFQSKEINFWKSRLDGLPSVLNVKSDFPREGSNNNTREVYTFNISQEVKSGLERICRNNGVTLFNVLLLCFKLLLSRYADQRDVTVGTTVANRSSFELENMIGFFVNQLALRSIIDPDSYFEEFLIAEAKILREAFENINVPFSSIVRSVNFERKSGYSPIFQHLFVLQNIPNKDFDVPGLDIQALELKGIEDQETKFDLTMMVGEIDDYAQGLLIFNSSLFARATIEKMSAHYVNILEEVVENSMIKIKDIKMLSEAEIKANEESKQEAQRNKLSSLIKTKRKAISISDTGLISEKLVSPDQKLPVVVTPAMKGVNLKEWAADNQGYINEKLIGHGGILFRGFEFKPGAEFHDIARELSGNTLMGNYGDLPKAGDTDYIYKSTPYPESKTINFHNESSHLDKWPGKIMFSCVKAAHTGGETAIVDCRKVYNELDPKIIKIFMEKKVLYTRNFIDKIDVSWQQFFNCQTRDKVEEQCRLSGMTYKWKEKDTLETRKLCNAIRKHPKTGDMLFFNQVLLFHVACLDRDTYDGLRAQFSENDFPRNVYFGDGSVIDNSIIEEIVAVMDEHCYKHIWNEGDIILLDNMLTAHARLPFKGERKIVVAIGNEIKETDV
jgi:amino acid adenylation domain-containing protein